MLPKRFGLLLITCYALLLASCSDDVLDTDNPEVEDGYVGALKAITLAEGMEEFRQPEFKLVLATESGDKIPAQASIATLVGNPISLSTRD